jgi:hypothetical protein
MGGKNMNDDFLHQYRKPPTREFSDKLYKTISQQERSAAMLYRSIPTIRRLAAGFAVLGLVFTMLVASSPSARARFLDVVRNVGGLTFIETFEYPGGSGMEKLFPEQKMGLAQARQVFPIWVDLPEYTPEGFYLNTEDVTVMVASEYTHSYLHVYMETGKEFSSRISIMVQYQKDTSPNGGLIVAPDSVEEVLVNGQPAGLVRGSWNYDTKEWGMSESLHLRFEKNDLVYNITAHANTVTVEELVCIAESIP